MTDDAEELINLLDVERLEVDLYRGIGEGGETTNRIYGGQVIAQGLAAAFRTVEDRMCHSLHAYFIRPGDPSIPVIYQVDRARDGGSFTTRRVVAIQHGRQILNMSASFHVEEEGWEYQHDMPKVAGPDGLKARDEQRAEVLDRIPEHRRDEFMRRRPIEFREVEPRDFFAPPPESDVNHTWFRMPSAQDVGPEMQQILMAYISDLNLLGSALRPHGLTWYQGKTMTASLDHAMWFHAPFNCADWHLYAMDAPFSGGARGFTRGSIFGQDGRLVASTAQEGLMRPLKPKG